MTARTASPGGPVIKAVARRNRQAASQARVRRTLLWTLGTGVAVAGITAALISARPTVSEDTSLAPPFTLTDSDGATVSLSDFRGAPVLLYFSEGAGCDSCIYQMDAIEEDPAFAREGVTVLPIVMNSSDDIRMAMAALDVTTPFLLDDGEVSEAYGTLGTGMHAGLPGHGFVLINADGQQVWAGNYPAMWISPEDLLSEVMKHL